MIEIVEKKDCTGCYACVNICPQQCISMEVDNEGFWYPKVDNENCVQCKLCIYCCPINQRAAVGEQFPDAYACRNKDDEIRLGSSSGGVFYLLGRHALDNGGVVFGARFDSHFHIVHGWTETEEGLLEFMGSKYVQSKIGDSYKHAEAFLRQGRKILFTGTPCQIAGLKSYLRKEYSNLLCVDFICHGVPSPKAWIKYLHFQEERTGSAVQRVAFRSKTSGWRQFSVCLCFANNAQYLQRFDGDPYMNAFLHDLSLRPSCYSCRFKTLIRQSDITLADFWGIEHVCPEMDDNKGTSLVLVNSEKGKLVLEEISEEMFKQPVAIDNAIYYNSLAVRSARANPNRNRFFRDLDRLSFDKLVVQCCSKSVTQHIKASMLSITVALLRKIVGLFGIVRKCVVRR